MCNIFLCRPLLPRGVLPPPLKRPRPDLSALPLGLKTPPGLAMAAAGFKRTLVPLGGTAAILAKRSILSPKHRLKGKGGMPAKDQPSSALGKSLQTVDHYWDTHIYVHRVLRRLCISLNQTLF